MEVRLHGSVADFRSVAVDVYRSDPVTATVELMVLCSRLVDRNPAPLLITVWSCGEAVGAAFQTLHSPLLCSGLPESAIDSTVAEIARLRPDLNGVGGPHRIATSFAAGWRAATGAVGAVRMRQRLHRLEELCPPAKVAGVARPAERADERLVSNWLNRFRTEALGQVVDTAVDPRQVRTAKESPDEVLLWTVAGDPVSLAGVRLPTLGVSRIGPVYTPPEMRGHGYGSAVTAAAAAWARRADAREAVLFTDPANPAANAAYRRIGFQPVSDFVRIDFRPSGS
jgi:RimJ/RimL family protein N-acetyltransferase